MFLEISQNSQENTCARVFFSIVAGLRLVTLLKKRQHHRCFPMNFTKFLETPFVKDLLWWLLLQVSISENFEKFQENYPRCYSYFLKALDFMSGSIWKRTSSWIFLREICGIFQNRYSDSGCIRKNDQVIDMWNKKFGWVVQGSI